MLAYDGRQRPTIDEIKTHTWMQRHCVGLQEVKIPLSKGNLKIRNKKGTKCVAVAVSVPFSKVSLDEIRVELITRYYKIQEKKASGNHSEESTNVTTSSQNSNENKLS